MERVKDYRTKIISKARELEKEGDDKTRTSDYGYEERADSYQLAAQVWRKLRRPKEALVDYEKAISLYDKVMGGIFTDPDKIREFSSRYTLEETRRRVSKKFRKAQENARKLQKAVNGEWQGLGLESRTASATIAIIGLIAGIFFLSY